MVGKKKDIFIKLEDVWKSYHFGKIELTVLKGVSLEVARGDFISVMGPSGSGKSTIMHIAGCLDAPTKGKVFLEGKNVSRFSEDELALIRGRKIGFIFQQFNLLLNLNALENVTLPMVFQGKNQKEREARAKELLSLMGLKDRFFHKPSELSGGERQRIAIARALANNPEVIIADEPTGNLDSKAGETVIGILTKLHQEEQKTIILVTHNPDIARYGREIIHIRDGRILPGSY